MRDERRLDQRRLDQFLEHRAGDFKILVVLGDFRAEVVRALAAFFRGKHQTNRRRPFRGRGPCISPGATAG